MLCFGFMRKTVLVTHWYFSCFWAVLTLSQRFSSFPCCPASKETGDAQGDGKGQKQDNWLKPAKVMSHPIPYCSCWIKNWESCLRAQPLLKDWLSILSVAGEQLHLHHLFCVCLLLLLFFLLLNCPYVKSQVLLFFPMLSPTPLQGSEHIGVWGWAACWIKPQQNQKLNTLWLQTWKKQWPRFTPISSTALYCTVVTEIPLHHHCRPLQDQLRKAYLGADPVE